MKKINAMEITENTRELEKVTGGTGFDELLRLSTRTNVDMSKGGDGPMLRKGGDVLLLRKSEDGPML